jgi:Effector Associated Constant Component 1
MEVLIQVAGGDSDELRDLSAWLCDERGLRGIVHLVSPPVGHEELGSVTDAIAVALGAGGAGTVLASSLVTWLQTRRTTVRLLVQRGDQKLVLDLQTTDNVLPLIERLLEPGDEP